MSNSHYLNNSLKLAFLAIALCGCRENGKPNADTLEPVVSFTTPDPSSTGYVGSEACAACHADVHKNYASHPMASSMTRADDAGGQSLFSNATFEPFPEVSFRTEISEPSTMDHIEQRSLDGEPLYEHRVPVDFRVGSGVHGYSYLLSSGGHLFQSPIGWYTEKQCWDMSPGYDSPANPGYERLVTHDCIACHAGTSRPKPGSRLSFEADHFAELAIGCERCHGPGAQHVSFHESTSPTGDDPILNLAELSPQKQNAICFQCHLQGTRRITRFGRSEFDFRPGMDLSDIWTVFLKSTSSDSEELNAVSHAEQMFQSRCYTDSANQLTCIACHDPHQRPEQDQMVKWYRSRCFTCHEDSPQSDCAMPLDQRAKTQPADSCVACHMPSRSLDAVPHTAHTDHTIRRQPDQPGRASEESGEILVETGARVSDADLQRAKGIFLGEEAFSQRNSEMAYKALRLLEEIHEAIPDDPLTAEAAGRAATTCGLSNLAIQYWDAALESRPDDIILLLLKAGELHNLNQHEKAAETYQRAIAADPHRAIYHGRLAHVLGRMERFDESIAAAEKALTLNPSLVQAHQWLTMLYKQKGDQEKSQEHAKKAEQLEESFRRAAEAMKDKQEEN